MTGSALGERLEIGVVSRSRFEEAQRLGYSIENKPNEDYVFTDPDRGLFIVADGLSGYDGGVIASEFVVTRFLERVLAGRVGDLTTADPDEVTATLRASLAFADGALFKRKLNNPEAQGMATTILAAQITLSGLLAYINAGNSALWLVRAGELVLKTKEQGNGPFVHNCITGDIMRSVSKGYNYFMDIGGIFALLPEDRLAIMSDGVLGSDFLGSKTRLQDKDSLVAVAKDYSPEEAAINLANASLEVDDTTVVVVDFV